MGKVIILKTDNHFNEVSDEIKMSRALNKKKFYLNIPLSREIANELEDKHGVKIKIHNSLLMVFTRINLY